MGIISILAFTHMGTEAHSAITTSLHATESISESLDMLSPLPDSPEIGILLHTLHQLALSSGSSLAQAVTTNSVSSLHKIRPSSENNTLKAMLPIPLEGARSESWELD